MTQQKLSLSSPKWLNHRDHFAYTQELGPTAATENYIHYSSLMPPFLTLMANGSWGSAESQSQNPVSLISCVVTFPDSGQGRVSGSYWSRAPTDPKGGGHHFLILLTDDAKHLNSHNAFPFTNPENCLCPTTLCCSVGWPNRKQL